jgi:dTDP-4-dehydrorhamnose 3,5-epimerase-like enzyme
VGLAGKFRIVLYDMREDWPTRHRIQEILLEAKPKGVMFLQVPPMVAHAFQGLVDGSLLVDIPSSEEITSGDFFNTDKGVVPYEFRSP